MAAMSQLFAVYWSVQSIQADVYVQRHRDVETYGTRIAVTLSSDGLDAASESVRGSRERQAEDMRDVIRERPRSVT